MMHQDEGSAQMVGILIDGVVQASNLRVVVFIDIDGQGAVERIDDHQTEAVFFEGAEVAAQGRDISLPAAAHGHDSDFAFHLVEIHSGIHNDPPKPVGHGGLVEFVVDYEDFARHGAKIKPAAAQCDRCRKTPNGPRLADFWRRDHVHGFAAAQKPLDDRLVHGLELLA